MARETNFRSLAKSVSYRAVSLIITGGVVFAITGKSWLAIIIALLDSLSKTLFYFLHERAWTFIPYGRVPHPLEEIRVRETLTDSEKQVIRLTLIEMGLTEDHSS